MMGTAVAEGENRAVHAAQAAISSPLLEDASIEGARGVLINVTGSADLTLFEVNEAAEIIRQAADPEAIILFGYVNDDRMAGSVKVTVIATGFDRADAAMEEKEEEDSRYAAPRAGRTPFLRGDDSGGFGPNASSSRDDFDIPTVLRRQMD
jgi:cell division protein FtsZ